MKKWYLRTKLKDEWDIYIYITIYKIDFCEELIFTYQFIQLIK